MPSIREHLKTYGLGRIADYVEALAKQSLRLSSGEESEDACSRLGGQPNLPDTIAWPEWRDQALPFVAQLDLMTIPNSHGLNLPTDGSLFFFFEGGENGWGFRPEDKGSAQVIYSTSQLLRHAPRAFPSEVPDEMRFTGVRLEPASADVSLPDIQDQVLSRLNLTTEERKKYWSRGSVARTESADIASRWRIS